MPADTSAPAEVVQADRFWLIVREPGMVPERKGPWRQAETAKILREFLAANPAAFIDYLTIGDDGTPDVEHGPMVLQYTDGRSMSVGRRHNARTMEAALNTRPVASTLDAETVEACAKVALAHRAPGGTPQLDYDEACRDIATAIRALSPGKPVGGGE